MRIVFDSRFLQPVPVQDEEYPEYASEMPMGGSEKWEPWQVAL
jgi:hypothetical protein